MHNARPMDEDTGDERLMQAYAVGDAAAFARLYDRHERPVHRYFLRQGATKTQADDLLQETWMAIVRNAGTYTPDAKFTTWLYTVARSKLVDHWRASKRQALFDDAANDPDTVDDGRGDTGTAIERIAASDSVRPDVRAMSRQQARAFVDAVEALPPTQREAFLLHVDGTLTIEQMAEVTAVGTETAKSRLRYAMRRMRVACADWLEPGPRRAGASITGARDGT